MASLNGVAQQILGVGHDMIDSRKAGALSGIMVASAGPMKIANINHEIFQRFNSGERLAKSLLNQISALF
jgi:hypothetical protein